jgi:hypothetical protein
MERMQVLLESEQRKKLIEIARQQRRSVASILRQALDLGLDELRGKNELWEQRARVFEKARSRREAQPTTYLGDLVNEARAEREEDVERIWHGE